MRKQAYLEISFTWLFALIVGAFILFLAIFAATQIINLGGTEQVAKTGKEIGILLYPLGTGFEVAKSTSFTIPVSTRIYNKCNTRGEFGRQIIQVSQKSFGKWTETEVDVGFSNKYIFAERVSEGKKFYIFSKPFDFPFKVSDLIYLTSALDQYCFVDAPEHIENEISRIGQENMIVNNCTDSSIEVCFSGNCDIKVNYDAGYVIKNGGDRMYFVNDALMYAGIFSEPAVYECQVQRLMKRTTSLANIYRGKSTIVDCNTNLNLVGFGIGLKNYEDSGDLNFLNLDAQDIGGKNEDNSECALW